MNGKRIWLGRYNSLESLEAYYRVLAGGPARLEPEGGEAATTGGSKRPRQPSSDPTLAELMADYLDFAIGFYGGPKAAEVVHFRQAFKVLRSEWAALPGKDFGPKAYKAVRQAMVDAGWCRNYIRDQTSRIKRFIAWCVEEERIPASVHHAIRAVSPLRKGSGARETEPVAPVEPVVVEATKACCGSTVRDMIDLMLLTGMRPGELVQLTPKRIDRSGEVWMFTPGRHKSQAKGKVRRIAIGPKAQAILAKYLFRERCFGYSVASFRRAIHRACDRAFPHPDFRPFQRLKASQKRELETWRSKHRWGPHRLRHNAATAARQVAGLDGAQVLLGHASASVTQIYAEANFGKAAEIALRIG